MKKPFEVWLLVFFLVVFAAGGLYGGIAMLLDPSGSSMELDEVLPLLPVSDYVLPGLFLLLVMGGAPLLLIYALFARPDWPRVESIFRWSPYYWAWTGAVLLVIVLAVWLLVEVLMIGMFPITVVTAVQGAAILASAMLPAVRKAYRLQPPGEMKH